MALGTVWSMQESKSSLLLRFFLQVLGILSIQTTLFHATVELCYEYFI